MYVPILFLYFVISHETYCFSFLFLNICITVAILLHVLLTKSEELLIGDLFSDFLTMHCLKGWFHQGWFFPIGPIWPYCGPQSPRKSEVTLLVHDPRRTEAIAPDLPPEDCGRSTKKRIGYYRDQNNPWCNGCFMYIILNHVCVFQLCF